MADVLLLTDQIADLGGNERAFAALLDLHPGADALSAGFAGTNVSRHERPDWHGRVRLVPVGGRRRALLMRWYARRMAQADTGRPRVAVSVVHGGWVLAAPLPAGARHVCYSAGLPPHLWGQVEDFLPEYPAPLRPLLRAGVPRLRARFRELMRRPGRLLVNSRYSAGLVEREVGRRAEVVHPPVRTQFFTPGRGPRGHFLLVARLVRQKRADIAIEAFRALPKERLVVVGDGPDGDRLRRAAPPNVTFTGALGDAPLRDLYRASKGFLCTSRESFGIAVCEALASGVPVIAPRAGGTLETVADGETGLLLENMKPHALAEAVRVLSARAFDPGACRASVERFSEDRFKSVMAEIVGQELEAAAGRPASLAAV